MEESRKRLVVDAGCHCSLPTVGFWFWVNERYFQRCSFISLNSHHSTYGSVLGQRWLQDVASVMMVLSEIETTVDF